MNLNRTVVAPLSSAIIALMLAGTLVVGLDQINRRPHPGEANLSSKGIVEVSLAGHPWVRAARGRVLRPDDRVRVVSGTAKLMLSFGEVELRPGSTLTMPPKVAGGPNLLLEQGELLVISKDHTFKVDGGTALASVTGVAKLRRSESLAAGVYEGNVVLTKDAQELGIPQYRQAAAAGTGVLPRDVDPLGLDDSDEWDRRLLPEVLELDRKLIDYGRAFEAIAPLGQQKDPGFFHQVIPALGDAPVTAGMLEGRAPGENLIGFTLVSLDEGDFGTRFNNVFGFRLRGARWGLVAADRDLNPNPVLGGLEQALGVLEVALAPAKPAGGGGGGRGGTTGGQGTTQFGATVNGPQPTPGATTGGPASTGGGPAGTPTTPSGTEPGTTPGPTTGPPPSTPPPGKNSKRIDLPETGVTPLDGVLDPLVNPLEDLLSGLLDGLLGASSSSTASTPVPVSAPAAAVTTTTTTSGVVPLGGTTTTTAPGLLGGVVNGLTNTVGGLTGTVGGLLG